MKKITCKLLLGFSAFCALGAQAMEGHLLLSAKLDGMQSVPMVTTTAVGVASFRLNETWDTMCVNISVNGLSGPITGIHVHEGAPGVSGAVVTDLTSYVSGNNVSAMLTGANLTSAMIAKYLSGDYYLNVHTAANAGGEIRGQIWLESDHSYTAKLDGAQQVPAVTTTAYGLGVFNLSQDMSTLSIDVLVQGLSGAITSAHLHTGAAGATGGVAIDLTSMISGNTISGEVNPSAFLADLKAGNIYINIHTSANAGGEIRGQLWHDNKLSFDAWLDGDQQVPAVTTTAMGVSRLLLNTTMDTLWYDVVADGLSGAITSAHFHTGAWGSTGGVAADISSNISGNSISGYVAGTALTSTMLTDLIEGNLYINVHTAANAGGEIRGQVYRLAREGYTMKLSGDQQVPAISVPAWGTGVVSVDRDGTNLHYMVVANGLSGVLTGAHFHSGAAGANGGVALDLSSVFTSAGGNASGFGYWKSTDATPYTDLVDSMVWNEMIYLNLHTTANAGGEIRGQVMHWESCMNMPSGINDEGIENTAVFVFPNPASDVVSVSFVSSGAEKTNVVITDMLGKQVSTQNFNFVKGQNTATVNVEGLNSGIYFITVNNVNEKVTKRFIKH
ncbi:MAG: CHRD domain-containing protein [Bacteroidia bacterium]